MSLVDKLDDVHIGDLLLLEASDPRSNRVGYVANYTASKVTLSNVNTRFKETGEIRDTSFLGQRYVKERIVTVPLEWFDTYRMLEKYVAPDNQSKE